MPMKFAFISTMFSYRWGGSEELWSQTALRLSAEGHAVRASVVFWPSLSPRISPLKQHGIKISTHSSRHFGLARRIWHRATLGPKRDFQRLLRYRPDLVVISQGDNRDGLEWMTFCKHAALPFVVIVHSNSELWWSSDTEARHLAEAYRAARKVFCVSQSNLRLLERQIGEALPNAAVIRNPYNVEFLQPPSWPTETGTWRLACVGRLDPASKGQDLLFQVLAGRQWKDRPIEVNIYGAGPCESVIRRLADRLELKMLHFRGHVQDIKAIWEHNHLLLLPSRIEGLPITLVEAMWCGRPAVVTDVGGNAELCFDRETGFVAAAPTVGAIEQAMEDAWSCRSDWKKMGDAARMRVEELVPKDPAGEFGRLLLAAASIRAFGDLR
jgi:glycosyltransferase involved in cell wall biosynthesis